MTITPEGDVTYHRGLTISVIRNHATGNTQVYIRPDGDLVTESDLRVYVYNKETGDENENSIER